jgi:hypothetical protein
MSITGIYKIINPNNKIYVGKSKNIFQRFSSYLKLQHCKQQIKLYNSLKKYGPENHTFEILEECDMSIIDEREIYWISFLKCVELGLNLTYGGEGGKLSPESELKKRINNSYPIYKFDMDGNFIKKYDGASFAVEELGFGSPNNINDCARGKYKSTYGYRWVYENDIQDLNNIILPPIEYAPRGTKWDEERRAKTKKSREGETRNQEYKDKIKQIKQKPVYRTDISGNTHKIFNSFSESDGSKIIGSKKLRNILNKNIYYKGYIYHYDI